MISKKWLLACICAVPLSMASALYSQTASDDDKKFVKDAIEGNNDEISLAQMALKDARSSEVKEFAQRMVDDHTKMNDEMRSVAEKIGVDPPTGTTMGEKALTAKLTVLSGESFDKAYMKAMVKDHRDDLAAFHKEVANGSDPTVKEAAQSGVKKISSHLKSAEQIAANQGTTASTR